MISHDFGSNAMLWIRRPRCIRLLALLLLLSIIFFLTQKCFLERESPPSTRPVTGPRFLDKPVYEYTSFYRVNANRTLEKTLDRELLVFEEKIKSSLREDEKSLVADRIIWQFATDKEFKKWGKWRAQWRNNNLEWQYHIFTSPPSHLLSLFESVPEIQVAYNYFPAIRADLTRYLLLWYYGGYYAEIDTWARIGMRDCKPIVSVVEKKKNISLMIGVDHDEPYLSPETLQNSGWSRGFRFAPYAMWAPKRFDPILRMAIVRAVSHAMVPSIKKHTFRARKKTKVDHIEELCGAGMFTDVVLDALSESLPDGHPFRDRDAGLDRRVTWKKFRALNRSLWIEPNEVNVLSGDTMRGLAVLPINVWGSDQNHSRSGPADHRDACVNVSPGREPSRTWQDKLL